MGIVFMVRKCYNRSDYPTNDVKDLIQIYYSKSNCFDLLNQQSNFSKPVVDFKIY